MKMTIYSLFMVLVIMLISGCNWHNHNHDGRNGHNALIGVVSSAPMCLNGGRILLSGLDINDNNILDVSEITHSEAICNGEDGSDGTNGTNAPPTPFTPVGLENPCGDAPGIYDEIFIRFSNGLLIASFSDNANGNNTRFSALIPGSYVTTDGDNCHFSIDSNYQIVNEDHHY